MIDEELIARRSQDLEHILQGLEKANTVIRQLASGELTVDSKGDAGPVTVVDTEVDRVLREFLPREGEGWLSEETADSVERLEQSRVWVVDPLDGTKEFVQGLPEWCVAIGLVEEGEAVAGGILNPASGELFIGSLETGVLLNGEPVEVAERPSLEGIEVLASRSEIKRGQWDRFQGGPVKVRPCGSVAYKLALVAAGKADATWSLAPKHEWDVAAGVALVEAAGGEVLTLDWERPQFNQPKPWLRGLVASCPELMESTRDLLSEEEG